MAVVGIDLGTTNSCVAVYKGNSVYVIQDENGSRLTPSVVTFTEKEILVGFLAAFNAHKYPTDTISDAKRLIGQIYQDKNVQKDISTCLYRVVENNGVPNIVVNHKKQETSFTIEDVSAHVLRKIKTVAETHLNCTVSEVVVTVPAYFSAQRRNATKKAATLAGFELVHIINEPTAAAIASQYNINKQHKRIILVYDFGGGTLDVSIMSVAGRRCEVIATCGDCYLGGKDVDTNLADHILQIIEKEAGGNISDIKMKLRLRRACEEAKIILSAALSHTIDLPGIIEDYTVTRDEFEQLNKELFQKTMRIVDTCLCEADLTPNDIEEVVLVGGSSRIPRVRKILEQKFPNSSQNISVNPDEVVAYGAAIYAARLHGDKIEMEVQDVLSQSLGIQTYDDIMSHVLKKNLKLPCENEKVFVTAYHFQTRIGVSVYQGEKLRASKNNFLGHFEMSNLRSERRGVVRIRVTFKINVEGLLTVTASEVGANNTKKLTVNVVEGIGPEAENQELDRHDTSEFEDESYVRFTLEKFDFKHYCDDLLLDYEHLKTSRPEFFNQIKNASQKCWSLKQDNYAGINRLRKQIKSLVNNINQ